MQGTWWSLTRAAGLLPLALLAAPVDAASATIDTVTGVSFSAGSIQPSPWAMGQRATPGRPLQSSQRSLVVDFGMLMTTIRPVAAQSAEIKEHDLGAFLGFSMRFARFAQVGCTIAFEGNDTSGVNDLLVMPLSIHAGIMTPSARLGDSLSLSADAALGIEYVVANRSDAGGGPCIGCYYYDVDLSSGAFGEVGMRATFGRGNTRVGFGVHYRFFTDSSDFAGRVTAGLTVVVDR
jgi:hypothetical protein